MKKKRTPKHQRKTVAGWLAYVAMLGAIQTLGRLRGPARMRLAGGIGRLMARALPIRRRVILENLTRAFPDWSGDRRRELLPHIYQHMVASALETLALPRMSREDLDAAIIKPIEGWERMEGLRQAERGFIVVTAHLGNFEWSGAYMGSIERKLATIAKPMHNPWMEEHQARERERRGNKLFSTRRGAHRIVAHLKAGGMLVILADQNARRVGIHVPFFGHPASTFEGPALMAYRLDLPILPVWSYRTQEGRIRWKIDEPIMPDRTAGRDAEVERLTRLHVERLEEAIHEDPAQYWWFHQRWKTPPGGRAKKGKKKKKRAEPEGASS